MRKQLFFGAVAALLLSGCSQDEMVQIKQDGIAYSVTAGKASRAADSYCNNVLPASFKVWAQNVDDKSLYIDGDLITNAGGNPVNWVDATATRYWPETALNFFAQVNGDDVFAYNEGKPRFNNFKVADAVGQQVDLMYAVKLNQAKGNGTAPINFRHALSQVCFQAKNTTLRLHVAISGVSVGHLANQGSFAFPTESTDGTFVQHDDAAANETLAGAGTWGNLTGNKQYDVNFAEVAVSPNETANLTCPGTDHENGFDNVMTLLPQSVDAWDPTVTGSDYNGAYFLLKVKLYNIAGDAYAATDKCIYDGVAAIPANVDWAQGKRYVYTFIFEEGTNGGYTPDPSNPQPVLTNIKYNVTVDDFIPVDGEDTSMNDGEIPTITYNYAVYYNANGGSGAPAAQTAASEELSYQFNVVSGVTPTREGYTFLGWAKTRTAAAAEYTGGETLTLNAANPTVTLYAIWEKIAVYTYTIVFNGNPFGAASTDNIPANLVYSGMEESHTFTIPNPDPAPVHGNRAFVGWSEDPNDDVANPDYAPGKQVTLTSANPTLNLYAIWGAAGSVVTPDDPNAGDY